MSYSIRDELPDEAIVFDNPDYDEAIIGVTENGAVAYSYDKMISCLVTDGMTEKEAIERIDYNAICAIPYAGELAPIIIYTISI